MIRRPLNERFADKVLAGIKVTTIRDNPWPIGKPIMLFRWSGLPYRSKQVNIAPVVVEETGPVAIEHLESGNVIYSGFIFRQFCLLRGSRLHIGEGFETRAEMDDWFCRIIKPGQSVTKAIMHFRLWTCADSDRYFNTHGKLP